MGPALPPAPPALVLTAAHAARLAASQKSEGESVTLGDIIDIFAAAIKKQRDLSAVQQTWRVPIRFGPRVKGKRDASLRSRSNSRKA